MSSAARPHNLVEPGSRTRIDFLAVDDDTTLLELIQMQLKKTRLKYRCVADAEQAFELLRTHRPDTLIIDFQMPKIDGLELITAFREAALVDGSKLYLTSSETLPDDAEIRALQCGAKSVIKDRLVEPGFIEKICAHHAPRE